MSNQQWSTAVEGTKLAAARKRVNNNWQHARAHSLSKLRGAEGLRAAFDRAGTRRGVEQVAQAAHELQHVRAVLHPAGALKRRQSQILHRALENCNTKSTWIHRRRAWEVEPVLGAVWTMTCTLAVADAPSELYTSTEMVNLPAGRYDCN